MKLSRRDMLTGILSTAALGGAAVATKSLRMSDVIRVTGPAVPAFDPAVDLKGLSHPLDQYGKIGNVKLSRLILGGNMIGGWAHCRDMRYYDKLVKAFFTDERIFRNFRLAEACGVNTILTNPALMRAINRYWREDGGRIQFISDCGFSGKRTLNGKEYDGTIAGAIASWENGASLVYNHGGVSDGWARANRWDNFKRYLDGARQLGIPVGIGCHTLETVKGCVERGIIPDFWMKTCHRIDYPTAKLGSFPTIASPKKRLMHDNIFVDTGREEVFAYMQTRPEPWIAFKILGAGIEHPRTAFPVCYNGGADFECVGIYDYQMVEDVNITNEYFKNGLPKRARPWCA